MLQPPVQELLRVGMHRTNVSQFLAPDDPRVLLAHRGRVRLGVLPIQALMTGRSYCLQRLDRVTTCCHRAGDCFTHSAALPAPVGAPRRDCDQLRPKAMHLSLERHVPSQHASYAGASPCVCRIAL